METRHHDQGEHHCFSKAQIPALGAAIFFFFLEIEMCCPALFMSAVPPVKIVSSECPKTTECEVAEEEADDG